MNKCVAKLKDSRYSNSSHAFELHFYETCELEISEDSNALYNELPHMFDFASIYEILKLSNGHFVGKLSMQF